ncbi:Methyltransferase type 11 [Desulfobulbus propionicus DSM 2032]|uniref:Methyltransferase type 11 n=1 Tax=Desulfobulbus propionicus (strain ATCC 33891 / DSM 2032 / VKM B-1956 / 1pr3) TaxID=577650 RepID=A0A7U4DQP0_DESPD|nr:class I SAM-dependent methyltransferase [Desulfobulbus propionicus]ADW19197.1 Methyltransferase type 11 [Desulfobulbus propionicus DSM 2032]
MTTALFDTWPEQYDRWFDTPTGQLVKIYESALLLEFLAPQPGERILDAGCGTGLFTGDVLDRGAMVIGVDLSVPMLDRARKRAAGPRFTALCADMGALPFADNSFDRVFSMTAIEFVADAAKAIAELNRVVRRGGPVVVTTLNSRSPWATRRKRKAEQGHSLFQEICFRSPEEMRSLVPVPCQVKTAIHFQKDDPVDLIPATETRGGRLSPDAGAFLAVRWQKQ